VAAACLGKSSCIIAVSNALFGDVSAREMGRVVMRRGASNPPHTLHSLTLTPCTRPFPLASLQPCYDTPKSFAAQALCSVEGVALDVAIPANARATVRVPLDRAKPFSSVTVSEGGAPVFASGAYVPGVAGVTAAALNTADATLDLEVGSGSYAFVSAQ
jgi:hypothetical protein